MKNFEQYIINNIPTVDSFHPYFQDAIKKVILAGGKRFRPKLLFAVLRAYNPLLLESSFSVAFGIELLHTYSLIHDDLPSMDNSDMRRGEKTLHIQYEEVTAILVGDGLNTEAFYQISKAPLSNKTKNAIVELLSYNGGLRGMVLGQAIDCYFENKKLDLNQLQFLHIKKTGMLIACSLKIGAIIAGLSPKECDDIYDLGIKLGLLFQIQDDIIDATKTAEEAGKPTNNDSFKNSFTNLLGVENSICEKNVLIEDIKEDLKKFNQTFQNEIEILIKKYLI